MQRWHGLGEVPPGWGRSVVTIGVFDGVHRGHRHVVGRAVAQARQHGVAAVVVTFDPHPLAVLRPDHAPDALATLTHRLDLLEQAGVEAVLVLPFTADLARQSGEDFVGEVVVATLHADRVVVGQDFRFGHRAAGDVALLRSLGQRYGFEVDAAALVEGEEGRWSSTLIRAHIVAGEVEAAARALARPHRVEGVVVHGDHRGRTIGYPTANLDTPPRSAIPADGIYAGWLVRDGGERMPAAISIGTNPTFGGVGRRVEGYALDRDDLDLYGEHVAFDFAARLRDTLRFDSVDALIAQMGADVEATRAVTAAPAPDWAPPRAG